MLLDLFNPFKREYDVEVRLQKSNALLYFLLTAVVIFSAVYFREINSMSSKILFGLLVAYIVSIGSYILDTHGKALSKISRSDEEIKRLKKELESIRN